MAAVATFADFYGSSAKKVTRVQDEPSASAASGDLRANMESGNKPAFSWLALIALLVVIRVVYELAE